MIYKVPFAILAGSNKGIDKEKELKDKSRTGKLYRTTFLDGDTKLYSMLKSGRRVLEQTVESVYPVSSKPPLVIGDQNRIELALGNKKVDIRQQEGKSLSDNIYQAIDTMRYIGENGGFVLMGGDLPSINSKDLEKFIEDAQNEDKDVVMGMSDVDEMLELYQEIKNKNTKEPKKFGIRFRDDKDMYNSHNPRLTFGTVFFIKDTLYEKKDLLRERMDEIVRLKRVFNEKENYPIIAEFLKDDGFEIKNPPKGKFSLAYFSLVNSTPLRKLLLGNVITKANSKYSMSISELEDLIEKKVLDSNLSLGITRVSPLFGYDIDDRNDIEIANSIYRKNIK